MTQTIMPLGTNPFDDDKLHEECGVFGILGHPDAAAHTALGLHALQHRGQESAGIVSTTGEQFYSHYGLGRVGDNFGKAEVIAAIEGRRDTFYLQVGGERCEINVLNGPNGKYLRAYANGQWNDSLLTLPPCI